MVAAAQTAKREDRRDAILDVAHDCFVAEGYGATSMSTIAARLGGSKGTLYNYFRSKEELFDAVVRRTCDRLRAAVDAYAASGEVRMRLVAMAEGFLTHVLSPQAIAITRVVISEGERFPELARLFYEAGPRRGLARIAELLEQLMDEGVLRRADPVMAGQQFNGLAIAGIHNLRLWNVIGEVSRKEIRARAELTADTFLRAYAP